MTRIRLVVPLLAGVLAVAGQLNGPLLRAADKALPSDLALAPRDGAGFLSIRVADLMDCPAGKEFLQQLHKDKEGTGDLLADLRKELVVPPGDIERLTFLVDRQIMIVRTVKPYDRDKLLDALNGEARVKRYKGKTVYVGGDERGLMPIDDNVFVRGPARQLEKLLDAPAAPEGKGSLDEALELAAGKHQVTAGVNLLAYIWALRTRAAEEFKTVDVKVAPPAPPPPPNEKKPPSCGGAPLEAADPAKPDGEPDAQDLLKDIPPEALPFKPLLQARVITLTLDVDDGMRLEGRAAFADKDLAADGETSVKTTLYVIREMLPMAGEQLFMDPETAKQLQPLLRQLQDALKTAAVHIDGTTVTVSAQAKIDPAVFAVLALQMRRSAEEIQSRNNLKQIALAMMNFESAYGFMPPPAICSKDGKQLLSWRVAILPYIEEGNLYNQFKLDESWDSPNNKKLLAQMPKVYAPVRGKTKQPYSTYYQVFVGLGAPFQSRPDGSLAFGATGPTIVSFTDGTSNTFLVMEAGEAVPWTKPDDIPFDEKKPVPPLGGDFGFGFHAALADGEVLFIKKDIDEKLLKFLIMPADGNVIEWDKVPMIGRRGGRFETLPAKSGGGSTTPPPANKSTTDDPKPPSLVRAFVGAYLAPQQRRESTILVQRKAERKPGEPAWTRLTAGKSDVFSTDDLVSLPGYNSELALGPDGGAHVLLHGHVPQFSIHPLMNFLMESAVRLHQPEPGFDADLTLDRGRIYLSNHRANGPVKVRLRFADQLWDLTLLEPDTEVGVDLIQAYVGDIHYLDDAPLRSLQLFVFSGRASVKIDSREYSKMPPRTQIIWDNKGPGASEPQLVPEKDWPLVQTIWSKAPPAGTNPADRQAIADMRDALDSLSRLMSEKKTVDDALLEARPRQSADQPMLRLLAVYSFGAIDEVDRVLDVLCTDESEAHALDRVAAIITLRRWIGRDLANGQQLYNEKKENGVVKESGLLIEGHHLRVEDAKTVFILLHDFPSADVRQPALFDNLTSRLRSNSLPIRELAYWHLLNLSVGARVPLPAYNAAWGENEREQSILAWKALIGKELPAPPPPPPPPPPK